MTPIVCQLDNPSYIKIYFDSTYALGSDPCFYNPPAGYEFQWGED